MKSPQAFDLWMQKVDSHLISQCGMSHLEFDDWRYHDAFQEGISPKNAARLAIKYSREC